MARDTFRSSDPPKKPKLSKVQVAKELKKIEKAQGALEPEDVITAAANPKHPLHSRFEWDDSKAGHKYRIAQARDLISWVQVEMVVNERKIVVPAYHRDPKAPPDVARYKSHEATARDPDDARAVIVNEFMMAGRHLKRARDIALSFGEVERIEELISTLDLVRAEISGEAGHA